MSRKPQRNALRKTARTFLKALNLSNSEILEDGRFNNPVLNICGGARSRCDIQRS